MAFRKSVALRFGAVRTRWAGLGSHDAVAPWGARHRSQRPRVTARTAGQHADVPLPVRMNLPL